MMSKKAILAKCLARLGKLEPYGIHASRTAQGNATDGRPDALLIGDDGRAWLTVCWAGTSVEPALFAYEEDGTPSFAVVMEGLIRWRREHAPEENDLQPGLLILAPEVTETRLRRAGSRPGGPLVAVIAGKSCAKPATLAEAICCQSAPVLDLDRLARWRAEVAPEVRIDVPRRRRGIVRFPEATVAPRLLDYHQERCIRLDLEPGREVEELARDLNVRLITGVAGCGKTLVLLHRASLLATRFPTARVLLLTYNKPLNQELRRRLDNLGVKGNVQCLTFYRWLMRVSPWRGRMVAKSELAGWVREERRRANYSALSQMKDEWFVEEMAWMCDQELVRAEDYVEAPRRGRGTGLSRRSRREMVLMLDRFRTWLRQQECLEWAELPLRIAQERPGAVTSQRFDHILIDEAQFFAPVWLKLVREALKPGGHLFLCADPTQGFLRHTSWTALGIEIRKRSHRLERPYRSTRPIMEFAREFYLRRIPEDEDPVNLPSPECLETLDSGSAPVVQRAGAGQDVINRLAKELQELRAQEIPMGDVLILVAGRKIPQWSLVSVLQRSLGAGAVSLVTDRDPGASCAGVAHLMAATGLERPIVFLLGLDELMAEELDPTLAPENRELMVRKNTRLVYTGLTRAMERLVIYASHPRLLRDFPETGLAPARCA